MIVASRTGEERAINSLNNDTTLFFLANRKQAPAALLKSVKVYLQKR